MKKIYESDIFAQTIHEAGSERILEVYLYNRLPIKIPLSQTKWDTTSEDLEFIDDDCLTITKEEGDDGIPSFTISGPAEKVKKFASLIGLAVM